MSELELILHNKKIDRGGSRNSKSSDRSLMSEEIIQNISIQLSVTNNDDLDLIQHKKRNYF